jgi:hypothetical protein
MGIDDFIRQAREDELSDRVVKQNKATPIDYARLRSRTEGVPFAPQKVYYAIRHQRLKLEDCVCGRHVIDINKADIHFGFVKEEDDGDTEE